MKAKKIGHEIKEFTRYSGVYGCHSWKVKCLYDIYEDENGEIYEKSMGDIEVLDKEDQEDWIKGMCTS